jgi:small subunit ribosomal protein S6
VRPYETMIIFDPEVEEADIQGALDRALEVVRSNGGTTGTVDRWGRRTLAYEMNHKREGYYVVAEFTAEPKASAELDRFLVLAPQDRPGAGAGRRKDPVQGFRRGQGARRGSWPGRGLSR